MEGESIRAYTSDAATRSTLSTRETFSTDSGVMPFRVNCKASSKPIDAAFMMILHIK
ncbi:MAG: hypothetical protein A4E66_02324 [Syntrophus sp. PtaB.Bin001]|nr:MAG: hypothetical protein A4E66_02324 [Syntrophus sp. PtaB.Bin001]